MTKITNLRRMPTQESKPQCSGARASRIAEPERTPTPRDFCRVFCPHIHISSRAAERREFDVA